MNVVGDVGGSERAVGDACTHQSGAGEIAGRLGRRGRQPGNELPVTRGSDQAVISTEFTVNTLSTLAES